MAGGGRRNWVHGDEREDLVEAALEPYLKGGSFGASAAYCRGALESQLEGWRGRLVGTKQFNTNFPFICKHDGDLEVGGGNV